MSLLKAERRRAGLGGRELEGPTRNVADPQRSHELEAGQPSQVLGVPFPQLRVLGLLADDGILHDGVAEVIDHRGDGDKHHRLDGGLLVVIQHHQQIGALLVADPVWCTQPE